MIHRRLACLLGTAALALLLGMAIPAQAADEDTATSPTLAAIDAAVQSGQISEAQGILYKLYFVKGSDRLPKTFALGGDRIKCGTAIVQEAREKLDSMPASLRGEVETFLVRPTLNAYIDTAHFRVHYSTSGTNMIYLWPNTAYRDSVMASCEYSYNYYVSRGWQIPPSDGGNGGGMNLIDCYVDQLSGVYGVTYSESPGPNWPSDYTAYFVIDNDYAGFGYSDRTLPMKVTVAHEYHHVVQMGYTIGNNWWMENMATWNEDEVYDAINDNYAYLGCYFNSPWKKATTFNGCFEYGAFIWPTYLDEHWTDAIPRDVQYCAATTNIFNCFNDVLGGYGMTYSGALAEWAVWNFYTRERAYGSHYEEAAAYPRILIYDKQYNTYPQYDQHPTAVKQPEATGLSPMYLVRNTSSSHNLLTLTYRGPACTQQVVVIAKDASAVVFHEYYMNLVDGNGAVDVPGWDQMQYCYMIASMARECGNGTFDYSFDAVTTEVVGVGDNPALYSRTVELDQNTPNPFGPSTRISYRIDNGGPVSLAVFDAGGRQIRNIIRAEQAAGEYTVRWDGRDDAGRRVAPGVYFYRLNVGDQQQVRKLVMAE